MRQRRPGTGRGATAGKTEARQSFRTARFFRSMAAIDYRPAARNASSLIGGV
jgi:hypothetical protein